MSLSDRERYELNQRIKRNPAGFVYLYLRPMGGLALQGAIKLRSLLAILNFVGETIEEDGGGAGDVATDAGFGNVVPSPHVPLKINVTGSRPRGGVPSIEYRGKHYSVNDTAWDRRSFVVLNILYQTTVRESESVAIPITIAK